MPQEWIDAIQTGGTAGIILTLLALLILGHRGIWYYGREFREREKQWKEEIARARAGEDRWQGIALRLLGVATGAVDRAGRAAEIAARKGNRDDTEDA